MSEDEQETLEQHEADRRRPAVCEAQEEALQLRGGVVELVDDETVYPSAVLTGPTASPGPASARLASRFGSVTELSGVHCQSETLAPAVAAMPSHDASP